MTIPPIPMTPGKSEPLQPQGDGQVTVSQGVPSIPAKITAAAEKPPAVAPLLTKTFQLGSRGPRLFGIDPSLPENKAKVDAALDEYAIVRPQAPGSSFNYQVLCRECGWQTHCVALASGRAAVREHAVRHVYQQ